MEAAPPGQVPPHAVLVVGDCSLAAPRPWLVGQGTAGGRSFAPKSRRVVDEARVSGLGSSDSWSLQNSPSPPSSLFVRPCPFPRLRPLLALAFGLGCRPGCFWDTWSRPPQSGDCDRQHVDPMLVHLTEHLRWSRSITTTLPQSTHLCTDVAFVYHAFPFRAPSGSASGCAHSINGEKPRESQHAQDNTRNQPGDPRAQIHWRGRPPVSRAGCPGPSPDPHIQSHWTLPVQGAREVGSGVLSVK